MNFDNCTSREAELADYANDEKNRVFSLISVEKNKSEEVCINESLCRRVFKISRIRRQSFASKTLVHISDMLENCCGQCAKYYLTDIFTQLAHVNVSIMESSDIIYPVVGRSSLDELYGFYYIPVLEIPSAYYFTLAKSKREMAMDMVTGCLKMWPLLAICLLMSLIAGFIAWAMESPFNTEEFPRAFHLGLFEGFWWSFVSMTTVGYGDKAPRSLLGRMFAVVWILIGITICSIYVASLTTEIMDSQTSLIANLHGKMVGGLKYRLHDASLVAQYGGILHEIDFNDTAVGISELIKMMERSEIDGFLINRSTYYYFARVIKHAKYKHIGASINHINMVTTEVVCKGEQTVTGMLVKNVDDYQYFKRYFENNWIQIQTCFSSILSYKHTTFDTDSYSSVDGLFYPFLYWSLGILAVLGCFGLIYEIRRHRMRQSNTNAIM